MTEAPALRTAGETLEAVRTSRRAAYSAYKPSGVEWLGDVPDHWEVKPLKYVASINDETLPETTDPAFEFDYVDIGNVNATYGIVAKERMIFEEAPSRARRVVRKGDTIVSTVRTYLRAVAPVRESADDLIVSTGFAVVRPHEVDPKFLSFALREARFIETVVSRSTGVSYPAINASEVGRISVPLPSLEEQRAIARFLDEQTRETDDLIEAKRSLLDLLKEKRQAVITHAVTRGLDPAAKLKSSGVEWLGDVPEHWDIKRLKHLGRIRYGLGEPPEYVNDGLPFIRATDIYRGKINVNEVRRVNPLDVPWSRNPQLQEKDILIVRSGAYTGDSAIVTKDIAGSIAGYDMVLSVMKAEPEYIAYSLLGKHLIEGQIYLSKLRAAQPHLNAEELGNCLVALPSEAEQSAIVNHALEETQKMDELESGIQEAIVTLESFRTSIISAAVTGKIDVREATT